jgi:hypothetical protein
MIKARATSPTTNFFDERERVQQVKFGSTLEQELIESRLTDQT